jgi:phospholipid/cholesterol/gamma-HCH transport system permease protein
MNAPASAFVAEVGSTAQFAWQVLQRSLPPRHGSLILPAAYDLGARSVLLVSIVCAFAGAMLAVQGHASLYTLGAPELLGTFVGYGGVREIFPLVSAGVVGARAGSAIAAEIATLKLGEQLDALTVMAIDPIAYLAVPRFIGAILVMPLVMVFGTLAGLGAAFITASVQLHVDPGSYLARLYVPLQPFDLWAILIKGVVFGAVIAIVTAAEGFRAHGGTTGVGVAANRAVVRAVIMGSVLNLALSQLLFGGWQ